MRKLYQNILKTYFHSVLLQRRADLKLTQSQMAEQLLMDDRSYIDLDHGKSCCSALTLALFLAFVCKDVHTFTEGLRYAFDTGKDSAA